MKTPRRQIIKKYAHAFLRAYNNQFVADDYAYFACYLAFLHEHHQITFYAYHAVLDNEKKIELFMKIFDRACSPHSVVRDALEKLITILAYHERLWLLADIIELIKVKFYSAIGFQHTRIATSHALSDQDRQEIIESFKTLTGKNIDAEFVVDPRLIAGLRVISQDYLWELSIAQKIKALQVKNYGY